MATMADRNAHDGGKAVIELAWRSIRVWMFNAMLFILAGAVGVFIACWVTKVQLS
jgi:hypothetical protein